MRKEVRTKYFGIAIADVECVTEQGPYCKKNLSRTSPSAPLSPTLFEPTIGFTATARDALFPSAAFGTDAAGNTLAADLALPGW
jgi:hypothetical protein